MVKSVLSAMTREIRGLHEAAYLLAGFTFLSQILALIRDRSFAHFFGASSTLDAYFAAFRIPDVVFALLTLFVSAFALVPVLANRGGYSSETSKGIIGSVLLVFGVVSISVSAALYFLIPSMSGHLFAGFSAETLASVESLSRIMLLQPILLGISSIMASVIQSSRRFFVYALAPIFYNVGIIFGVLFLYEPLGIEGLAWGVVLGALLHLLIQAIPALEGGKWMPRFSPIDWRGVREVCFLSFPRAASLFASQGLLLVFASAASLTAVGSVTALSFAFNLQSVPLSIIAVSYASALFPSLALLMASKEVKAFTIEVWAAVRHVVFWMAPAIALFVVLRAHVVRVILGSGSFGWDETRLTAAVLALFALSLIAQGVILILSRAYYAAGRSLEPIVINVGVAAVAGIMSFWGVAFLQNSSISRFFLEDLFRISGVLGSEVIMIPLVYSVVTLAAALVFALFFSLRFGFDRKVYTTLFHASAASILAASAAYGVLQVVAPLLQSDTFLGIFTQGLLGGIGALIVWAGSLYLLKNTEFLEAAGVFKKILHQRIGR